MILPEKLEDLLCPDCGHSACWDHDNSDSNGCEHVDYGPKTVVPCKQHPNEVCLHSETTQTRTYCKCRKTWFELKEAAWAELYAKVRRIEVWANIPYKEGIPGLSKEDYDKVTDAIRILLI